MANGGGGQYDLVSASGDADLRLIYGGDVRPINIKLIPSWKQFHPFLQSPAFNTIGGKHYGVSFEFGPNVLLYSTKAFKTAPTSWSVIYSKKYTGQITVPDNPIQIADAALYLSKTSRARITDPYELTQPQFNAAVSLLKSEHPLIKKYWDARLPGDLAVPEQDDGGRCRLAVPDQHAEGRQRRRSPTRSRTRARPAGPTPGCSRPTRRIRTAPTSGCSGSRPRRSRPRRPSTSARRRPTRSLPVSWTRSQRARARPTTPTRRCLLQDDQVLEDAAGAVRQRQERLRAVPGLGHRLDADHVVTSPRVSATARADPGRPAPSGAGLPAVSPGASGVAPGCARC